MLFWILLLTFCIFLLLLVQRLATEKHKRLLPWHSRTRDRWPPSDSSRTDNALYPSSERFEEFGARRDEFLQTLREAVADCDRVICRACNHQGPIDWRVEITGCGVLNHPQGTLEEGIDFAANMINQGMNVAYGAAIQGSDAEVWVAGWEPTDEPPPWPSCFSPQVASRFLAAAIGVERRDTM